MTNIFISYSPSDQAAVGELLKFLKPLERQSQLNIWTDREDAPGADWEAQISDAIESANIAVLLVSADYLASDWIYQNELPELLRRAEKGELTIFPVIVRPSAWVKTPLAYLEALPPGGQAVSELPPEERDRIWAELSDAILAAVHQVESQEPASAQVEGARRIRLSSVSAGRNIAISGVLSAPNNALPESLASFFISHAKEDGDFAEIVKFRLSSRGFSSWIDADILEAGLDWRQEIDQAILDSCALILVLSPSSKASEYVTYEWAFALGSGLRIVPLLLRETTIHPRLEAFQYLDFSNRRARPWSKLLALLDDLRQEEPNPTTADGPSPPLRGSNGR